MVLQNSGLFVYIERVISYGERFRALRLRHARTNDTVLSLAKRLGSDYAQTVYGIEKQWRVPTLVTIERHARAIGCEPWELLDGVQTEYDEARSLSALSPTAARSAWANLLSRYRKSTERSPAAKTTGTRGQSQRHAAVG